MNSSYTGHLFIVNNSNFGAYLKVDNESYLYISPVDYNYALNGDCVSVIITNDKISDDVLLLLKEYCPDYKFIGFAKVSKIIERSKKHNNLVGILNIKSNILYGVGKNGGKYYSFKPDNKKYPSFIVLSRINQIDYLKNVYATISFTCWNPNDKYPRGSCDNIIGEVGHFENELLSRMHANGLIFPNIKKPILNEELKMLKKKFDSNSSSQRLDLTDKYIFSIDPPNCLDVDDALHFETKNDGFCLGIHIADVSEWIEEGSLLDQYAQKRMSSIYLPNKTYHMLPQELSENYCSLLENQKRYSLSLLLDIDFNYNIKGYQFVSTIIKNKKKMTYKDAENLILRKDKLLCDLLIATKKINEGNKYYLSEKNETDIDDESPNSHQIVETCMILANIFCAKYLTEKYGNCILRIHMNSNISLLENNIKYLESSDVQEKGVLENYLKKKAQTSAKYNSLNHIVENGQKPIHFGLGTSYYTHFTSPIRRYIDLINHRLIKGISKSVNQLDIIAETANDIGSYAKKLYRDTSYLALINSLEKEETKMTVEKAFIVNINTKPSSVKIKVYIPKYQLTKTIVLCHYKVIHLYDVIRTLSYVQFINKETHEITKFCLYDKINVNLIPMLNSDHFDDKLKISVEWQNKI